MPTLVEIGPAVEDEDKMKTLKVYNDTNPNNENDDDRQQTHFGQKGSQELS